MADTTGIEWCDSTWSPWEGCTRVSIAKTGGGGCDNCYAEAMNKWLRKGANWGPGAPRLEYSDAHWEKPVKWQRDAPTFETLHGRHRRVFPSVCDPFDNEVHEVRRARFWGLIRLTPHLTWLLLTKRIGNARSMLPADWGDGYPNVWLGATVVNQAEADRDIPKLLAVPARVRFLSIEPMLGPIDLTRIELHKGPLVLAPEAPEQWRGVREVAVVMNALKGSKQLGMAPLSWAICGGESGPKARPMHPDWARNLRDQCAAAGMPFLFKQWGEWTDERHVQLDQPIATRLRKTVSRLDIDGRVHPMRGPGPERYAGIYRVGKKLAGRLLDGAEHNGFPEVSCG